jgi:hypothetical protein
MSMFCPKCGNPDQSPETYCRRCGTFLPDLSKPVKRERPPEEHIKVNSVLSLMTVIVCITLSILLFSIMGFRSGAHPLVYVTAGLLIAMAAWHIQTFIRVRRLKKQWDRREPIGGVEHLASVPAATTGKLLDQPDFSDMVPPSVIDHTTRQLSESEIRSAQTKH